MDLFDKDLQELVTKGKSQGYLTYDEVNDYLPDEEVNPEKLDNLLIALEEQGIELVNHGRPKSSTRRPTSRMRSAASAEQLAKGEVPDGADATPRPPRWASSTATRSACISARWPRFRCWTGDEEIALAKKIEVTRKRFRRTVIGCAMAMRATVATLVKVHKGLLPFDRTIKVSLTERLTKEQIIARMPHNLHTLSHLMDENRRGLRHAGEPAGVGRSAADGPQAVHPPPAQNAHPDRGTEPADPPRAVDDAADGGYRSPRMDEIRRQLRVLPGTPAARDKRADLRRELRDLMVLTQETPQSRSAAAAKPCAASTSTTSRSSGSSPAAICGWWSRSPRSTAIAG